MRYRTILIAAALVVPVVAWTASNDSNGKKWLAQVPDVPGSANAAYEQWTEDGSGTLKPGETFNSVDKGIDDALALQNSPQMASPGNQGQVSSAQQLAAQYGTPQGQAALKAMSPAQLMALAQQMQPQANTARAVSPQDQQLLQKIANGVYPQKQQVMADVMKLQNQVNTVDAQWDKDLSALGPQEQTQMGQLPVCPGEASIPSSQDMENLELKFADQRIAIASQYLPQINPVVAKMRTAVTPEIDFGDGALAAWAQISDPGLKQQVSASAHGAEQQSLGDVSIVEKLVEGVSQRAAEAVVNKKAIQKKYANAKGC